MTGVDRPVHELVRDGEDAPGAFLEVLERLSATVDEAVGCRGSWLERLRAGLVAFLGFFEDRPEWGRLLLLDVPARERTRALRCEQRVLGVLTGLLDDGSPLVAGELMPEPQLVSELVAGGVVAVLRKQMLAGEGERLVELAPSLMAFVVMPYLGHGAAQVELTGIFPAAGRATTEASDKRGSTRGPVGPATTASAYPRGAGWSRRCALSQTGGVGGSPVGGLADRSIGNREDKGVVEK